MGRLRSHGIDYEAAGLSTANPMTAAKAAPCAIPNVATATAMASSKLFEAAVKESVAVWPPVTDEPLSERWALTGIDYGGLTMTTIAARRLFALACLALTRATLASGEGTVIENPHREYVKQYEGTKTCIACHEKEAKDAHASIHYQWKAGAPNLSNAGSMKLGKMNVSNDFCTNPAISWIAKVQNADGKVIAKGCSACHAGLGAKPQPEATQAQLENVDCLMCHSSGYRRDLAEGEGGKLHWAPAMKPDELLLAAQNPQLPDTAICLRCHAASGGGINYKRGDLEAAALKSRSFDVHLGSSMTCLQCHKSKDHKLVGSGSQMAGQEAPSGEQCGSCHDGTTAHKDAAVVKHLAKVACTACHVPSFAKDKPTDMHRDFSKAELVAAQGRYEPAITFQKDVKPVYAWWNGKGTIALPDAPVSPVGGKVRLFAPEGSRADSKSKLYPFKLHTANMPVDSGTKRLIPVKVGIFFKTGNTDAAVREGGKAAGMDVKQVEWVQTERYMSIFHEVAPKENAVKCSECHGGGRVNWKVLGYPGDPKKGT